MREVAKEEIQKIIDGVKKDLQRELFTSIAGISETNAKFMRELIELCKRDHLSREQILKEMEKVVALFDKTAEMSRKRI